jgi:hypothetical protein
LPPECKLRLELRLAQARRWKMSSVVSLKKNKISRQCLWALAMKSSKNTNYTKSTSLRIWDYFETGLSWILDYVKNLATAQSDWAFGASSYRFQPSLTHDVLFSVVQSVSEHSGLVAAKLKQLLELDCRLCSFQSGCSAISDSSLVGLQKES